MEVASYFHISVTGQIEFAEFPLGADGSQVFCRYEVVAGPDWRLVAGLATGITQCSTSRHYDEKIVFNMPLEFTYKATNAFGWPQIVFCVYGKNVWGAETSLGYARMHVPIFGVGTKKFEVPIMIPRCANTLAEIMSWITGKNAELKNPKILTEGTKNKGLQTDSYGLLTVSLQTISRGASRMGYEWGSQDSS